MYFVVSTPIDKKDNPICRDENLSTGRSTTPLNIMAEILREEPQHHTAQFVANFTPRFSATMFSASVAISTQESGQALAYTSCV